MQTQLLVTVKNANFMVKAQSSLFWFVEIFKKSKMEVRIDNENGEPIVLKARKQPYEIQIDPGFHTIYFDDPTAGTRDKMTRLGRNLVAGAVGLGGGMASGGATGAVIGVAAATGGKRNEVRYNELQCELNDGDELKLVVKPQKKKVKITVVN